MSLTPISPSQQLVCWANARNRLTLEVGQNTSGTKKAIQDFLATNEPKLGRQNIPVLRALSATLVKCELYEGEFAALQEKIHAVIHNLENFQSCFPNDVLYKVVEYLQWNDPIEQLIDIPPYLRQARLVTCLKDSECRWIGNEAAWSIDKDPRVGDKAPDLVLHEFGEFFLGAELWQQEVCLQGWIAESKNVWKIYDIIPGEVEKLFLNFDILEGHPDFFAVLNRFPHLKSLMISKSDPTNSISLLNMVNFSNLEVLDLRKCSVQIDDDELEKFMKNPTLKNLKTLDISSQLGISKACVQRLQRAFPNLEIRSIYRPKARPDDVQ